MRSHSRAATAIQALGLTLLMVAIAAPSGLAADRDKDGLSDAFESRYGVTSPDLRDSDWDGVVDGAEDSDGDRLANHAEQRFRLHPGRKDSDGDGRLDGAEDHDKDGRTNAREQDQRPLPGGVKPSLRFAKRDRARVTKDCIPAPGSSKLVRCVDGDKQGDVRIVLMGDSHATMLYDPIRRAGASEGWRVETMLKGSCIPLLGSVNLSQWNRDRGRACRAWRIKAFDHLAANPPDLLILIGNDNAVFVDGQGRTLPRSQQPAAWRKGIRRISDRLSPRTTLLALGDVPDTKGNPTLCLKADRSDMSRCTTRRKPLPARTVERAVRAVVAEEGQRFGTLHDKICPYDPCPVIQGQKLIWRSHGHLSATFARKLTPSLRKIIRGALE